MNPHDLANPRWHAWLIVAAVLLYACLLQGVRPLYSPDEGRYTDVALQMLDSGDWLHPKLHAEVPHWSKPPLAYWSIGASFAVFGRHVFAARLPAALAFGCTILLLLRLGRRFVPDQRWLPALVYAGFVLPTLAANLVTTDSLLTLWETLQVVAFVELWWAVTPTAARRARWLLGIAMGLAFLTKGPPGLLALAACLVFAVWSEGWRGLQRAFGWEALLGFAIFGLGWFAVVVLQDPAVLHYFLVEEVVNRVASDKMHRNGEWYGALKVYAPTLLLGTLPWLAVLGAALWRHRRDGWAHVRANPEARLLLCWLLLPFAVFVFARSRLPLYLLPLFPPLALVVARRLAPVAVTRWRIVLFAAWCLALVVARAAPAWLDIEDDDGRLAAAVNIQLAAAPDEIAFVETAPRYGLRFYLGSPIERLLLPGSPAMAQAQDLSSELVGHEGCRLLLVRPARADELAHALGAHGIAWRRLQDARGYALFALQDSACDWRVDPRGMLH